MNYSETYFSQFAFDILALLKNTYQPNVLYSLHCSGSKIWEKGSCVETRYFDPEAIKRYKEETIAILKAQGFADPESLF